MQIQSYMLAVALSASPLGHACTQYPLSSPTRLATLADRQPTLRWQAEHPGPYRVQVAVVLPEARVLASYDLEVNGAQFTLPAPVPAERAGLKVLVSRNCRALDTQDLHAQGAWFFVDTRSACTLQATSLREDAGRLAWSPVPAASGYKVRLFRRDGEWGQPLVPLTEIASAQPFWTLPPDSRKHGAIATVQPVCDGQPGRAVALPLSSASVPAN